MVLFGRHEILAWVLIGAVSCNFVAELFLLTERLAQFSCFNAFWRCKRIYVPYENIFLTSSELGFALKGFALKVILFFVIEFLVCQLDDSRAACRLVERGLSPSLAVFAVMDLLVIPRLRRRIKAR